MSGCCRSLSQMLADKQSCIHKHPAYCEEETPKKEEKSLVKKELSYGQELRQVNWIHDIPSVVLYKGDKITPEEMSWAKGTVELDDYKTKKPDQLTAIPVIRDGMQFISVYIPFRSMSGKAPEAKLIQFKLYHQKKGSGKLQEVYCCWMHDITMTLSMTRKVPASKGDMFTWEILNVGDVPITIEPGAVYMQAEGI